MHVQDITCPTVIQINIKFHDSEFKTFLFTG